MAQLQRLKWIPMLLRAYTEARIRTEQGEPYLSPQREQLSAPPVSTPSPSPRKTSVRRARVDKSARTTPTQSRMTKRTVKSATMTPDLKAVLREIRETKRRLGELDGIRSQLESMQKVLSARLSEPDSENGQQEADSPSDQ